MHAITGPLARTQKVYLCGAHSHAIRLGAVRRHGVQWLLPVSLACRHHDEIFSAAVQLEDNKVSERIQICMLAVAIAKSQGRGQEDRQCNDAAARIVSMESSAGVMGPRLMGWSDPLVTNITPSRVRSTAVLFECEYANNLCGSEDTGTRKL